MGTIYYLAEQSGWKKEEGLVQNKVKERGKKLTQTEEKRSSIPVKTQL